MIVKDGGGKSISLNSLLLFILVVCDLYFLYPGNIAYFMICFFLLFFYLYNDLQQTKYAHVAKLVILVALIFLISISVIASGVYFRRNNYEISFTHDGLIQTEVAIQYIIDGKNPYTENFFNTPMARLPYSQMATDYGATFVNPALYHIIYLPYYLFFSIPFYLLSNLMLGWYDQRFVHIIIYLLSAVVIYCLPNAKSKKLFYLVFFAFNPLFLINFTGGNNDIFVFFWIILALFFMKKEKVELSSLSLGLAVVSKHFAWPLVPFYFIYFFLQQKKLPIMLNIKLLVNRTKLFWLPIIVFIVPFLVWDANSFIDDIFKYANGTSAISYPINGAGISTFLLLTGIIDSATDYFPFWMLQGIVCLPLFYFLVKKQSENNNLSQVIFNYGLLLFAFIFFSRFFHWNYIGYLSLVFTTAYFFDDQKKIDENIC